LYDNKKFINSERVEVYSSSYYRRASELCHTNGAMFFIHACGQQKDNLKLISSYGVDGLEGVASPPLGDVMLDEAMKDTSDGFIITGDVNTKGAHDTGKQSDAFAWLDKILKNNR
jgi:uroporphyrinogen-III decarboxylase